MATLKLISWNVNGIRAWKKKGKLDWLAAEDPDVFCVQETKAHPDQLDDDLLLPPGYVSGEFHSCSIKRGYSGVATFAKQMPKSTVREFGIEKFDQEGRVLCSDFGDFTLVNVYFPKGETDSPRLQYKYEFYEALFEYLDELRTDGHSLIICGDFNIAHKEIDLARPKQNQKTSGFLPEERAILDRLVDKGYLDSLRLFQPDGEHYSWWSYRSGARARNVGWRLDYFFVTEDLRPRIVSAGILPEVEGSDHCPVTLEVQV